MKQKTKYVINSIIWTLITTIITGAMFQTFLLEKGMPEEQVGSFVSLMQFVQTFSVLLFSKFVDRIKNVIRFTAFSQLLYLPLFIFMAVLCFKTGKGYISVLTVLGVIGFSAAGLYNVLTYKIPYYIMDINQYGKWAGVSAIFASVFMFLLTTALSAFEKNHDYFSVMRVFYPVASVCVVLFFLITLSYKKTDYIKEEKKKTAKKENRISLLKYKRFTVFIIPNLIRGFCNGILTMAVTIGYSTKQLDVRTAAVLLVIMQTVSIPANLVFTKLTGKEPLLILLSSVGIAAPVFVIGFTDSTGFLVLYGIAYFSLMILNIAVPVLVTRIIDYRIAGEYNGWRMLLNNGGIFLASFLCMPMVNTFGATATWITAGVFQLISGSAYFIYCKRHCGFLWAAS